MSQNQREQINIRNSFVLYMNVYIHIYVCIYIHIYMYGIAIYSIWIISLFSALFTHIYSCCATEKLTVRHFKRFSIPRTCTNTRATVNSHTMALLHTHIYRYFGRSRLGQIWQRWGTEATRRPCSAFGRAV